MKKKPTKAPATKAFAVQLNIGTGRNLRFLGWSKEWPQGCALPLQSTAPGPLLFESITEAKRARAAYARLVPGCYPARVKKVEATPKHKLSDKDLADLLPAMGMPLFAELLGKEVARG